MKTVRNISHRPLRVHLPRGKTLHLGPGKEGQIGAHDVEFDGVRKLVDAGELEVLGDGSGPAAGGQPGRGAHEDTHGHHPGTSVQRRGDR